MDFLLLITLFIIIATPIALFAIFKPTIDDAKIRNNISNSDIFMQHYCFLLERNQSDTIDQLKHDKKNNTNTLKYTFDANSLIITFYGLNASIKHQLTFYDIDNKTYLKVSRIHFTHQRSTIPLLINRFFIKEIGATPIDYNSFESMVCEKTQS
ncbi:MAG: hypothetical protein E7384_00800 [Ruminococcaceae bacterium]|nr:hypothetical protein [Oscillospiraceae bacterium]